MTEGSQAGWGRVNGLKAECSCGPRLLKEVAPEEAFLQALGYARILIKD